MRRTRVHLPLISLIVATCLRDVIDAVTSTPSPSNGHSYLPNPDGDSSSREELTVALMMPLTGELGFERNAAASTLAIDQARRDGLLTGVDVRYSLLLSLPSPRVFRCRVFFENSVPVPGFRPSFHTICNNTLMNTKTLLST